MNNLQINIENYLEYCRTQKRLDSKTIKAYCIDLHQFSEQIWITEASELTVPLLETYIAKLHQQYAPKTVKRKIASLKALFHHLEYKEIILHNHRKFLEYNTESFLEWGKAMGHSTLLVIKHFLFMHKVEQQGYKSCASLMKLADRYGTERLENACAKALSYTPNPSLKNISTILKNGQDGRVPVYPAVFLSLFSAFCTIILTSCLEFPLIQKWDSLRQFRIPASAYDTGLP